MKYYIGIEADTGKLAIGHKAVFLGNCVRIVDTTKNLFTTVIPESLHLIDGTLRRVRGMDTDSKLETQEIFEECVN